MDTLVSGLKEQEGKQATEKPNRCFHLCFHNLFIGESFFKLIFVKLFVQFLQTFLPVVPFIRCLETNIVWIYTLTVVESNNWEPRKREPQMQKPQYLEPFQVSQVVHSLVCLIIALQTLPGKDNIIVSAHDEMQENNCLRKNPMQIKFKKYYDLESFTCISKIHLKQSCWIYKILQCMCVHRNILICEKNSC